MPPAAHNCQFYSNKDKQQMKGAHTLTFGLGTSEQTAPFTEPLIRASSRAPSNGTRDALTNQPLKLTEIKHTSIPISTNVICRIKGLWILINITVFFLAATSASYLVQSCEIIGSFTKVKSFSVVRGAAVNGDSDA